MTGKRVGESSSSTSTDEVYLKGLGHEIRIRFKWYGLIGLGLEKVRQIFIIFLTVPLILN